MEGGDEPFYEFGKDAFWSFEGYKLAEHKPRVRWAFRWTVLLITLIEVILAAWPIAATAIWTFEASLTWIWFLYIPRVMFLLWALITTTEIITLFGAGHKTQRNFMRTIGAFAPSSTLAIWTVFSWIGGAILGVIFVILTAATWSFFDSTLLPVLAIVIGAVSILESIVAPFLVYRFGVYIPILKAHNAEKKKRTRTPRTAAISPFNPETPAIVTRETERQGGAGSKRASSMPTKSSLSSRTPESRLRHNRVALKTTDRLKRVSRQRKRGS